MKRLKLYLVILIIAACGLIIIIANQKNILVDTELSAVDDTSAEAVIYDNSVLTDLESYVSSEYSIDNPYIETDVYEMNPLSAYVVMPVDDNAKFSYTVQGKDETTDFTYSSDFYQSQNLVIPVIGLYANYDNTVDITITYQDQTVTNSSVTISTGDIKSYSNSTIETTTYSDDAYTALEGGFTIDNRCNGYDINGEIRLNLEIEDLDWQGNGLRINDDGTFLMGTMDYLYNISLTGKIFHTYYAPEGYYMNHDYMSASNGMTYIILSPDEGNMTYLSGGFKNEGFVGVYNTDEDQEPVQIFDINQLVADNYINATSTFSSAQDELVHLNAITYDAATDTIMLSSQSQNVIIAIDPNNGEMKWIIKDSDSVITNADKVLTPIGNDFVYTNGQHSINVTTQEEYDDGDDSTIEITVYNNEFCLDYYGNELLATSTNNAYSAACTSQDTSSLLVYRIDTTENKVELLDSFELSGYYSSIRSSWFQSPDYQYNYITYGDMGQFVATDSEFNIMFTVQSEEADAYYQNMYRSRVFTSEQITDILDLELQY